MRKFNVADRLKSFKYAWAGICELISSEHNFWIHCAAVVLVSVAGFIFDISKYEWIAVILCFAIVLAAEAFNTSIEALVDLVSPNLNPLAGKIKDIAAGAVLICAIASAIIGLVIFIPYIF